MGSREKHIINDLLLNAGSGKRLFRVNCGMAWAGKIVGKTSDTITLFNPHPFYGMPEGTSDVIGWESINICDIFTKFGFKDLINCDMCNNNCRSVAVFTAIEVKTPGVKTTKEQSTFIETLNNMGGKGIIYHE